MRVLRLFSAIPRHKLALGAFLIPLMIRSIPEILAGPYPVGWDTIAFYVPNTLDWAAGRTSPMQMLGAAPLMYMISVPVYTISHINPIMIFKVMGPILYGSMVFALFRFLQLGLKWNGRMALGGALLTSLYFVTLRISWDLYRNMLGLTFILLALPLLENSKSPKTLALLSTLIALAVASDQLTGVVALSLVAARVLTNLLKGQMGGFARLAVTALPGAALFLSIVYVDLFVSGVSLLQGQSSLPSLDGIGNSLGFLGYAYLPLAPLILLGIGRIRSLELRSWLALCFGLVIVALLPFYGLVVTSYRWSLLVDLPVCVLASAGLARIVKANPNSFNWNRWAKRRTLPIFSMILVALAILYIALPAQSAFTYYTAFPDFVPTSMVQDSVPLSDMGSLRIALSWVAGRMGPGDALLTHQAIYGWARAYLPSNDHIINYGYSNPLAGVVAANLAGYSTNWVIWWSPGLGWHDQAYLPPGFATVFQNGNMVVYTYR